MSVLFGSLPSVVGYRKRIADSRPRWGLGAADAWSANPAALLTSMTPLTSSSVLGRSGTFFLQTTVGNYGWVAVQEYSSSSGIHFFDGIGFGGWSGAGLPGNNVGASPDPTTSSVTYTDAQGIPWRLFRQDFVHANPSSSLFTVS